MATVDDLLRRLHRQAADLSVWSDPDRHFRAQLRGWAQLATASSRVLDALDPRPQDRELYELLQVLRRGGPGPGRVDAGIAKLALVVGALGDVISTDPSRVAAAGQGQRSRLQANIQAALHAAARATLDTARSAGQERAGETFRQIAEATETAALLPPSARVSTLERMTVTRLTPDTVDGAVQLWADTARQTFTNHRLVSGVALQEGAATLALLCRASADTFRDAARRGISEPDAAWKAAQILGGAATAWRNAATWPSGIQLGGRAHEHRWAVQAVRAALTGPPLARLTLRERTRALRAALDIAATIGELQADAVERAAKQGGLWVAHERPNLRPLGVERRHVKLDWARMDPDHPAARVLTDRAYIAQQRLISAAEASSRAVIPSPTRGETGRIALIEERIIANWWETVEPPTRARRPDPVTEHSQPALHPRLSG
jgi:hypothetical protein